MQHHSRERVRVVARDLPTPGAQLPWRLLLILALATALLASLLLPALPVRAQATSDECGEAEIINDEGGPVAITGEVNYTNAFFTLGVAQPVVILEDQTGFVTRNEEFVFPEASQALGQITSDFYDSPFSYSLALPIEPQGTLNDVDNDGEEDEGVMVFAIAYWTNTFGDPYLEVRDQYGGGWSTAYASTEVSDEVETEREIIGGSFLIYAPDDEQCFPSGFGDDGLLFTEDDPIVSIPEGYTLVNMDEEPFVFDRTRNPEVDLIEPEGAALEDFSDLSYPEAFDALVDKLSVEYAFTEYKDIDWEALREQYLPRFEEADEENNPVEYLRALRDFSYEIPDGHVNGPFVAEDFQFATGGGLGIAIRDVDDERVIVNFVLEGSPAEEAGIELGTEILAINGEDVDDVIDASVPASGPFSTDHFRRLQQLRYAIRFPIGEQVEVTFQNEDEEPETVTLTAIPERESFNFSSFNVGLTGFELPLAYDILEDSGYGYVQIYSFSDNELLTVQLWERMIRSLNQNGVEGLIIDMRQNGGGSGFLADQMAAYFFDEELELGNTGRYQEDIGEFYFNEDYVDRFYLPSEDLRYSGEVAVLVGPNCASACEFFSYDVTIQDRAAIVGQYPTAGLGGSVDRVLMPLNEFFQFTAGRAVDMNGDIHIEGIGVEPTVEVPVTEETLFTDEDVVLEAAIEYLDGSLTYEVEDGGEIAIGETVEGTLTPGTRIFYTLNVSEGDIVNMFVEDVTDGLDAAINVLDEGGNPLLPSDTFYEELEIPVDLTLILEIGAPGDEGEGDFALTVEDATADGDNGTIPPAADGDNGTVPPAADDDADGNGTVPPAADDAGDNGTLPPASDTGVTVTGTEAMTDGMAMTDTEDITGAVTVTRGEPITDADADEATVDLDEIVTASRKTQDVPLDVYAEADLDSELIGQLEEDAVYDVLAVSEDGAWVQIATPELGDEVVGWVSAELLTLESE